MFIGTLVRNSFPETLEVLITLVMEEEGGTIFGLNGTTAHHFITLQSKSSEEEKHTNMDNVDDANDLLKNGIIVETNKGLVCVPLKDLLISGVGGLSLSVEDFQNVAAQLLIQQNTDKITTVETLPATETGIDTVNNGLTITDKTNHLSSVQSALDFTLSEALVAQFQTDSDTDITNITSAPMDIEKPVVNQVKKRGGWPKGRKRKPELQGIRPPKAPATGYVLYSNEKRPLYKDLPFPEVTKILGNEWSKLGIEEKRVYLERAEVDKKRYREELRIYRQSDAYRAYLRRKRNKNLQGNATEESDMDGTDEIEDEDNKELYCRTCDQWFSSFHNKKEHLYGRQHLQAIAGDFTKERLATEQGNGIMSGFSSSSTHSSPDESSMDGTSLSEKSTSRLDLNSRCVSVTDSIAKFMEICAEQEQEVKSLRSHLTSMKTARQDLVNKVFGLKEKYQKLTAELERAKERRELLIVDLLSLCTVPSLFEVS